MVEKVVNVKGPPPGCWAYKGGRDMASGAWEAPGVYHGRKH